MVHRDKVMSIDFTVLFWKVTPLLSGHLLFPCASPAWLASLTPDWFHLFPVTIMSTYSPLAAIFWELQRWSAVLSVWV